MSGAIFEDDGRINLGPDVIAADELKAAMARVFTNEHGVKCGAKISLVSRDDGTGQWAETYEVNGKRPLDATPEEIGEVLEADRAVREAEREVEAAKYTNPETNPMIKI